MTQEARLFRVGGVPEPWHGSPYRNPRETFSIPRHYLVGTHPPTAKDPTMASNYYFEASNGIKVQIDQNGYLLATGGTGEFDAVTHATGGADYGVRALREFFTHERDTELGRWRDPDNPNMVVYRTVDSDTVMVLNEDGGVSIPENRGTFSQKVTAVRVGLPGAAPTDPPHETTAARYFAKHPERKPWHDATKEEIWVVTIDGDDILCRSDIDGDLHPIFGHHHWATISNWNTDITHAERVWPVDE